MNEGTIVYRPILSEQIDENIYKVCGKDIYNSDFEQWEFIPDTIVIAEEKLLEGDSFLVAVIKLSE